MTKKCYNYEDNKEGCPCTYESCDKKGMCCECLKYHLSMKQLPACVFSEEAERTYDRSFVKFVETQK